MIRPSCGAAVTHLQDVADHVKYGKGRVVPDVLEKTQSADVKDSLSRKFTKEEVQSRYGRGLAKL